MIVFMFEVSFLPQLAKFSFPLVTLVFGVNLRAVNLETIRRAASVAFVSKIWPFLKLSPRPQDAISYPKLR